MYGHKQSGSRQLNRHWQSGGGGGKNYAIIDSTLADRYYAYIGMPPFWDKTNLGIQSQICPKSKKISGETATMKINYKGKLIDMDMGLYKGGIVGLNGPETSIILHQMIPVKVNGNLSAYYAGPSGPNLYCTLPDRDEKKFGGSVGVPTLDLDHGIVDLIIYNIDQNTTGTIHPVWYWYSGDYSNLLDKDTKEPIKALEFDLGVSATTKSITLSQSNIQVYQSEWTYTNKRGKTYKCEMADPSGAAYWWYKGCNLWPLYFTERPFYKYLDEFLPEEQQKDRKVKVYVNGYLDGKKVW